MGWTLNFGHPYGGWVLMGLLVGIPLVALTVKRRFPPGGPRDLAKWNAWRASRGWAPRLPVAPSAADVDVVRLRKE